jgi:hypothetical protein
MGLPIWLGRRRAVIHSPLLPHACAEALSRDIDGTLTLFGKKPVIGHVDPWGGSLRKRIHYRNDFRTTMSLAIETSGGGSRIVARSFMSVYATVFMVFWFGMVSLVPLAALAAGSVEAALLSIPGFMLAFGIGLVAFGRWLARDEHDFLLAFIRNRVDGEIESSADGRFDPPIVS